MKKISYLFLVVLFVISCTSGKAGVAVTVTNDTGLDRENEVVEISYEEIIDRLQLTDTTRIVVLDTGGEQVPYQITYDGLLIFPASVKANDETLYTIEAGEPIIMDTRATGKYYPERLDDVAWENDRIAFRTYGPALQKRGEKGFGYDIWVKSVSEPVVESRYANELDPEMKKQIDSLRKAGKPEEARALYLSKSYHVDHGNGMDCYNVGPTLGGGTAALYVDDSILYPYSYKTQEILDNGPLRFTVNLVYNPLSVGGDTCVVENRLITLDAGSQLNKTTVSYTNTKETLPIVTGIVIHEADGGKYVADASKGYIGYADPTDNVNNGIIYVGAVIPANVRKAEAVFFPENEKKSRGAFGHVLAFSDYEPYSDYTYYWGAGWSKYRFDSFDAWTKYLDEYAQKVRNPLIIKIN